MATYGLNGNTANVVVRVPDHVVYRTFVSETVVLNLKTGQYHGLNPTAGRILEILDDLGRLEAVIPAVAAEFEEPVDRIESDLKHLCTELLARELLELVE